MGTPDRHDATSMTGLHEHLLLRARGMQLFHLIEILHGLTEKLPRVRASRSLHFAGGEVETVIEPDDLQNLSGNHFEVFANLLRLCGSTSPLPMYLVEEILHDELEEGSLGEFLDIFHNRLYELMYLGVRKQHIASRPFDKWVQRLLNLIGVDATILPQDFPAPRLLALGPLLSARARSASNIARALNHFLHPELGSATISIREFSGDWIALADQHLLRLGTSCHILGRQTVLGSYIFDPACCATIEVGLVGERRRNAFARNSQFHQWLKTLIFIASTSDIEYRVEVRVAIESVGILGACYLGSNAWLRSAESGTGETAFSYPLFESPETTPDQPN